MTSMSPRLEISITPPSYPQLKWVRALDRLNIEMLWVAGSRTGRTDIVDLSPLIKSFKYYRPIRESLEFKTVRLIDDGFAIAWGDGAIEMAATAIVQLAEETLTAKDFRAFLGANKLTQVQAAAILGRSKRQIANYLAGSERIPRVVCLACLGFSARQSQSQRGFLSFVSLADRPQNVLTSASLNSVSIGPQAHQLMREFASKRNDTTLLNETEKAF
jgi:hypothetical protein